MGKKRYKYRDKNQMKEAEGNVRKSGEAVW